MLYVLYPEKPCHYDFLFAQNLIYYLLILLYTPTVKANYTPTKEKLIFIKRTPTLSSCMYIYMRIYIHTLVYIRKLSFLSATFHFPFSSCSFVSILTFSGIYLRFHYYFCSMNVRVYNKRKRTTYTHTPAQHSSR